MQQDIGAQQRSSRAVQARARELLVLAQRACEFAGPGPRCDPELAERQFAAMRAVLGPASLDDARDDR